MLLSKTPLILKMPSDLTFLQKALLEKRASTRELELLCNEKKIDSEIKRISSQTLEKLSTKYKLRLENLTKIIILEGLSGHIITYNNFTSFENLEESDFRYMMTPGRAKEMLENAYADRKEKLLSQLLSKYLPIKSQ
jgi:hypothetical protein